MSEPRSGAGIPIAIAVALITGTFAAVPGILSFINTPKQIEAELAKVKQQGEMQIQLQRDRTVAEFLARLDDPAPHIRSGAALSLSALGGDTIAPVLVGKLREAVAEGVEEEGERQFLNALKQSLFAIGAPALEELLHLNRDLTPAAKQAVADLVKPGGTTRDLTAAQADKAQRELLTLTATAEEVKDVIRAILFKTANLSVAPPGEPSPLLAYGISLSHSNLSGSRLIRLNLSGVDLSFADLRNVSLEESHCVETRFDGALLAGALFQEGVFDRASFRSALIRSPSPYFGSSSFDGADFAGARIDEPRFTDHLERGGALNLRQAQEAPASG